MPSSSSDYISAVVNIMRLINPSTMLDIGIGFGKYGFLAREYLELWDGRDKHKREDWKRTIDGIEAFEEYINPAIEYIYDHPHRRRV